MADSEVQCEDRQDVPLIETLTEGLCNENPAPPEIVMNTEPETAEPEEALTTTIFAELGRSYDSKKEQEDHSDRTETTTLGESLKTTEAPTFPRMHESATHENPLEAEAPSLNFAKDNEC